MCELVCRFKEDILSKFWDSVNNRLNICETFLLTYYKHSTVVLYQLHGLDIVQSHTVCDRR